MAFIHKLFTSYKSRTDGDTRIGELNRIWYDSNTNTLRIQLDDTAGGTVIGGGGAGGDYTLPTASTTVKGGVKIDGTTIAIDNQVISVGTIPYSSLSGTPTIPTNNNELTNGAAYITSAALSGLATETYVTTRGYLTTVAYADVTGKPTLFSGSYTDLTDKPTIPSLTGYATETFVTTRGYLTSVGTISYNDLTDKPNLAGTYTFNVAADDSTLREISADETVKFIGAGGITTASDAEGAITITQGSTDQIIKVAGSFASDQSFKSEVIADLTDGVSISTWMGLPAFATNKTWEFDYNGNMTFPDSTVQTTAWTGTAAAGTLTGDTLNSTVVTSSLTSVGTLTGLTVGGSGGDLTMTGGSITGVGNITASGILAVNASGGITTTQTSFDIVNSTATTVNIGGAATAVNIGAITGTLTLNNPTVVGTQTTQAVFDTVATTVNAFRASNALTIGSTGGTMTLRNPTVVGTQTTVNLWNTTSTTVNAFGAATTVSIGAATGTLTINNPAIVTGSTGTLTLFNTNATTVTAFGAATTINLGYTNSVAISNTFNIATNAQDFGTKTVNIGTGSSANGTTYINIGPTLGLSYVTVNGTLTATLTGNASTATKLATARAINGVNFDGSAAITVTAEAGTLSGSTLASGVTASSLTSVGTLAGLRTTGLNNFGSNTFTKAGYATGDITLDNGGTDTPGLLMYYANNNNFAFDSWNGTFNILSGQLLRVVNNLNESGGAVKMAMDTTGNIVTTGFIQPSAWRPGQVIRDTMLNNSEFTVNNTTVATSTTDTTLLTYSYTPTSSSSYLIIHVHVADYRAASDTGGAGTDSYFSRIKVDDAEIVYSRQMTRSGDSFRTGALFPLTGRYTNSDTNAKTITVGVRRDSADDSITITSSSTALTLRITEIAR